MNRSEQQWRKMEDQINRLRKQNQQLKRLLQLSINPHPQIVLKRSIQSHKESEDNSKNDRNQQEQNKNITELKKQWAEWSNRLQASIVSKHNKIRHNTQMQDLRKTTFLGGGSFGGQGFYARKSLQSMKSKNSQQLINLQIKSQGKSEIFDEKLSLIQDVFLYGPSVQDIQNAQQRKFIASHQLYYPEYQKDDFQVYGNYLFPNQLQVKHIREKNHGVEVNKMIFKNNKKLDCNIFIFQGQQNNSKLNKINPIITKVNPSKWMYALSIQFSDFVSVPNEFIALSKLNKTISLTNEITQKQQRYVEGEAALFRQPLGGTSKKRIQGEQQLFKSNFCLCIMTYFPFIRFLKDILIQVFDTVKLRRINKHNNCLAYKQIDINYFIQQLKKQLNTYLNDKLKMCPEINGLYEFNYNQIPMKLDLKQSNLINEMVGDWGFKILKIMDKQSLLDIFCYIMMEQSICFLSQDRNILTFIILLYVIAFTLPFGYPHPCVSVVFNDELLQTPFTAVLGINKGTKWLQDNIQHLTQNKQNKLIVNLNEQQVKIKYKKKPRTHKSQKLKKIFYSFYKKIQTSALPTIFKKKIQLINRETTKQQNQHVYNFFTELNQYYQQQIINHLPNKEIIDLIKQGYRNNASYIQDENPGILYNLIVEKIERYLGESRRGKGNKDSKDSFIEQIIKRQHFKVYIDRLYEIL